MDALPLSSLLPPEEELGRYYRYEGSLTTPDCYEGVIWTVFERPVELSLAQVSGTGTAWRFCVPSQGHTSAGLVPRTHSLGSSLTVLPGGAS